ncbi:uncharacterized protein LOC109862317 [Pseudomyrmex gracilis]|uniref:uncharacterized protein LOC109862317 n=1 Tax=Pseudomyrmex gracilis TaxID=219809 RepID=UPI000995152B|nr:uncharacterized protein LOC109862317 [Pseudomyrmex gracilis]
MIFSYVDQTKKETYLILPRIPAEWIFPYWENPATKAKFTIRIIHEYSTTALSHMPGDRIVDKNKFYTLFSITPVMVTQLVAIVVVPYEYAIPIVLFDNVILATRFEVRKDILYASILIEDITIFLREKVKDVISASHVRYVALPINSSSYNTIVTTGLVLFSVIQEMFSNWLVAFKQSDPWFVEGFSTFYGVYLSDQTKILKLLNIFLEDTSHKNFSENSISNQIYYEVVKWTCILDGVKCKEHVNAILKWHLENSVKNKLLPSWQKWIYCQSLILENGTFDTSDLWQNIEKIYSTDNKKEQLFELLSCYGHNIVQILREIEASLLTKRQSVYVLFDSVTKYSKNVTLLNGITSRLHNYARDNLLAVVTFIINNTYSEENLKKISVGLLYNNLIDIYNIEKARFMLDIIMKKAENRRTFLNKISSAMGHKPHELFK